MQGGSLFIFLTSDKISYVIYIQRLTIFPPPFYMVLTASLYIGTLYASLKRLNPLNALNA